MAEDHERATGPWEIEWITLPDVFTLVGMEVHADRMRANLDVTRGLIVSEAVMMGLAPKLGRDKAHDVLYAICHDPAMGDKSLTDLLLAREDVTSELSEDEIRKLTDPAIVTLALAAIGQGGGLRKMTVPALGLAAAPMQVILSTRCKTGERENASVLLCSNVLSIPSLAFLTWPPQ